MGKHEMLSINGSINDIFPDRTVQEALLKPGNDRKNVFEPDNKYHNLTWLNKLMGKKNKVAAVVKNPSISTISAALTPDSQTAPAQTIANIPQQTPKTSGMSGTTIGLIVGGVAIAFAIIVVAMSKK
jgi:hypothetical protein